MAELNRMRNQERATRLHYLFRLYADLIRRIGRR